MQAKAGVTGVLQLPKAAEQGSMGLTSSVVQSPDSWPREGLCHPQEAITAASSHGEEAHRSFFAGLCSRQYQQSVLAAAQIAWG